MRVQRTKAGLALRRFFDDGMPERAASLAFYGLLSLIPILLISASAIRLFGDAGSAADAQSSARDAGASSSVAAALRGMVQTARSSSATGAGSAGVIGALTLLYGASKVFTDAGRALDQIHGEGRVRRPLGKRLADFGWSVVLVVCGLLVLALVVLTGAVVHAVAGFLGLGDVDTWWWDVARWPLIIALGLGAVALVKWAGPVSSRPPFRLLTTGNVLAVGLGLLASAGYSIYLSVFASYNATYGAFAALIILMLWIWSACMVFLFSAEYDEVDEERRRAPDEAEPRVADDPG